MPGNDDLALLVDAARASGEIAHRHWREAPEVWHKSDGAGPVTEADLEIDRMLNGELLAARPNYGWLSEETEDSAARLDCEQVFIVDPIDGTRAFVNGERTFSHSLAVATDGRVTAAAVYLPMLDKLFTATLAGPAALNGAPIHATKAPLDGASVLASRPNFSPEHWRGGPPPVTRHFRSSLAYRLCLVAEGRFDAMLTLRDTWEWDVAAGSLIAANAGACVTDATGNAPAFNAPRPMLPGMIAAGPAVHDGLSRRLTK